MDIDPVYLLQLTVNGIMLGLLYALIAVGLALIFGVLEIVNFAHGEFLMAGRVRHGVCAAGNGTFLLAVLVRSDCYHRGRRPYSLRAVPRRACSTTSSSAAS